MEPISWLQSGPEYVLFCVLTTGDLRTVDAGVGEEEMTGGGGGSSGGGGSDGCVFFRAIPM